MSLEFLIYLPVAGSSILLAIMIHRRRHPKGGKIGASSNSGKQLRRRMVEQLLVKEELNKQFEKAGHPLKLTAFRYQIIRYGLITYWAASNVFDIVTTFDTLSLVNLLYYVASPFLLLIMTNTVSSPVTYILERSQETHAGEKNRELFSIYNMISDEYAEDPNHTLNLRAMLTKLREYTDLIRPAVNEGLKRFDEGPDVALRVMAEAIGTKEAREVCSFIGDLEALDPDKIAESVRAREDAYYSLLRENKARRRKLLGHVAYGLVFSPFLFYMWDLFSLTSAYMNLLNTNMNN